MYNEVSKCSKKIWNELSIAMDYNYLVLQYNEAPVY